MTFQEAQKNAVAHPFDARALCDLGVAYAEAGQLDVAIDFVNQAVATDATQVSIHCTLGDMLRSAQRVAEAACAYRQALQLEPDNISGLSGLGSLQVERHETGLAVASFRRAVKVAPDNPDLRCQLARALIHNLDFDDAASEARKVLKSDPNFPAAHLQLSGALAGLGQLNAAAQILKRMVAKNPNSAEGHILLVQTLNNLNFSDEVPELCQRTLVLAPNDPHLHFEIGTHSLATGDWRKGWLEYEWRFKLANQWHDYIRFLQPLAGAAWRGESLEGKNLFIHCEQGLGDTLWFIRFLPELAKMQCNVTVSVQPPLFTLLQCLSNIARIIPFRAPNPQHDYQIPLHSVPRVLGTTLENLPRHVPYLTAPATLPGDAILDDAARLRVGFVWSTRPLTNTDHRNVPVSCFETLFELDSIAFYSLQVSEKAVELEPFLTRPNVHTLKPFINDVRDTASIIMKLDLVITIDTSVAHLAGALGARVWVLLPYNANWRWLKRVRGGPWYDKSPWYPTMRLFRSETFTDWKLVFRAVRADLLRLAEESIAKDTDLIGTGENSK